MVAGGSFMKNDTTFRGRHCGTFAYQLSSTAYSGVEFTYRVQPRPVATAGLIRLPKTQCRLRAVAFGFEGAGKIVGDAGAQVRAVDGEGDLEGPLDMAGRGLPPPARMGDPSGNPMDGHRRHGIAGVRRQVDRFLDEFAGSLDVPALQSGLGHTRDQVRQELTIAQSPQMLSALAEEPVRLRNAALL